MTANFIKSERLSESGGGDINKILSGTNPGTPRVGAYLLHHVIARNIAL